jgi:hypothetical protein
VRAAAVPGSLERNVFIHKNNEIVRGAASDWAPTPSFEFARSRSDRHVRGDDGIGIPLDCETFASVEMSAVARGF